jgi:hypothetical protein
MKYETPFFLYFSVVVSTVLGVTHYTVMTCLTKPRFYENEKAINSLRHSRLDMKIVCDLKETPINITILLMEFLIYFSFSVKTAGAEYTLACRSRVTCSLDDS